ncbi:MAG: hypothetical protein WAU36_14405 [Cyclobacteriaceae bacterium]
MKYTLPTPSSRRQGGLGAADCGDPLAMKDKIDLPIFTTGFEVQ